MVEVLCSSGQYKGQAAAVGQPSQMKATLQQTKVLTNVLLNINGCGLITCFLGRLGVSFNEKILQTEQFISTDLFSLWCTQTSTIEQKVFHWVDKKLQSPRCGGSSRFLSHRLLRLTQIGDACDEHVLAYRWPSMHFQHYYVCSVLNINSTPRCFLKFSLQDWDDLLVHRTPSAAHINTPPWLPVDTILAWTSCSCHFRESWVYACLKESLEKWLILYFSHLRKANVMLLLNSLTSISFWQHQIPCCFTIF